jgi:hypothetical protein
MKNYTTPSIKVAIFSLDDVATTASRADMAAISNWENTTSNGYGFDSRRVLFEEVKNFYE